MDNILLILILAFSLMLESVVFLTFPVLLKLKTKKRYSFAKSSFLTGIDLVLGMTLLFGISKLLGFGTNSQLPSTEPKLFGSSCLLFADYILMADYYKIKKLVYILKKLIIIFSISVVILFGAYLLLDKTNNNINNHKNTNNEETYTIKEISSENEFNDVIASNYGSIIIITNDGCPFCENYIPIVKNVGEYHKINTYILNTYDTFYNTLDLDIEGLPMTLLYKNNNLVASQMGAMEKNEIELFLQTNEFIK